MGEGPDRRLDGTWTIRRAGGLLPPLGLLHKNIDGGRGATSLGALARVRFSVRDGSAGLDLVYAGPLRFIVDRLEPDGAGGWLGETRAFGVVMGRFRMRRAPSKG